MKLHTKRQAPREGQAVPDEIRVPYVPTHADYLQYLVDSHCVYQALEDIVSDNHDLAVFRNTGLERTIPLQTDIDYLVDTYIFVRDFDNDRSKNIPVFVCHYYNFYFAHTAGGRMIGKQMSALLLNKKTLAFYQVRVYSRRRVHKSARFAVLSLPLALSTLTHLGFHYSRSLWGFRHCSTSLLYMCPPHSRAF
jgi:hypothetical protein